MSILAPQVSAFVMACEALHWRLHDGHALSLEEKALIKRAAIDLMIRAEGGTGLPQQGQPPAPDKAWRRWDEPVDREPHP